MTASIQPPTNSNPFLCKTTEKPIVALAGKRNGYLMIAPSQAIVNYDLLPETPLLAAKAWAGRLEQLGSPRAYWIVLSELTPHLHIHIFPRWPEDSLKGLPLFEAREHDPQPQWTPVVQEALRCWAQEYQVEILNSPWEDLSINCS